MRILHTADWHLGDRLGRIDRTDDLRRAVERIAAYCDEKKVDLLLVAGDLFSELNRPDGLREAIRHLQQVFLPFLQAGGTILTLTGNHDNENFCQMLRSAMTLAAPLENFGERVPAGRLYLTTDPTLLRVTDKTSGQDVQFILMPYPTPAQYLKDAAAQNYKGFEEKNRFLLAAFTSTLREIQADSRFDARLPTVLGAHIHVRGGQLPTLFRLSEEEDVVFSDQDLPTHFAYIALGHIHKPQAMYGLEHVRYSGSIDRLDLGESQDEKGVVLLEIGPAGLVGRPEFLPLEATPVYAIDIRNPKIELPILRERYPDQPRDLVHIQFTYAAGVDNLEDILRELETIFPRWYHRQWTEASELGPSLTAGEPSRSKSFEDTVRDFLRQELQNHPDDERDAVLARAEELLREVRA
jgi:exonuclease SbcD